VQDWLYNLLWTWLAVDFISSIINPTIGLDPLTIHLPLVRSECKKESCTIIKITTRCAAKANKQQTATPLQTDRWMDRQTDDMWSQDRALHYSASCNKKKLDCCRLIRAMRCITCIVLDTKVDDECDKPATVYVPWRNFQGPEDRSASCLRTHATWILCKMINDIYTSSSRHTIIILTVYAGEYNRQHQQNDHRWELHSATNVQPSLIRVLQWSFWCLLLTSQWPEVIFMCSLNWKITQIWQADQQFVMLLIIT